MNDNRFEKLKVWQRAHNLVIGIYKVTASFPKEEKYSLTDQVKRSSASIAANIVEGSERQTVKEYLQFLHIAKGSCAETKYHLLLARDLGYLKETDYCELSEMAVEMSKMISSLISYLRKSCS